MQKVIKLTETQLHQILLRTIKEAISDIRTDNQGWQCIAFLQDGSDMEVVDELYMSYQDGNDDKIKQICSEYVPLDGCYAEVEQNPHIARYDTILYQDEEFLVLYNNTVGGVAAIYMKCDDSANSLSEADRHKPGYYKEYAKRTGKKDRHKPGYYNKYNQEHPERLNRGFTKGYKNGNVKDGRIYDERIDDSGVEREWEPQIWHDDFWYESPD